MTMTMTSRSLSILAALALPLSAPSTSHAAMATALPSAPTTSSWPTYPTWPSFPSYPTYPTYPTLSAPTGAGTLTITGRDVDSIALTWHDGSGAETSNQVQRRVGTSGSWVNVGTFGAVSGWTSFEDTALSADSLYCYRVRSANSVGAAYSAVRCPYTTDGNDFPVWRAQLRVTTADVSGAGTDDAVEVALSSRVAMYQPAGNATWLDAPGDDFERGAEAVYDLSLSGLDDLSAITLVSLKKAGGDDWCVKSLELLVDGEVAFERTYGNTAATCRRVNDDAGANGNVLTISHDELRAHPAWSAFEPPTPSNVIQSPEIRARVEAMIGDVIHGTDLRWGKLFGSEHVEVFYVDDATLHVDVDLTADVDNYFDPEVDVDFDLAITSSCEGGVLELTIEPTALEVEADYGVVWNALLPNGCVLTSGSTECLQSAIEDRLAEAWRGEAIAAEYAFAGQCPDVYAYGGAIVFDL